MNFSGTVRIADVDDFISPAQDCVVTLDGKLKEELLDQVRGR